MTIENLSMLLNFIFTIINYLMGDVKRTHEFKIKCLCNDHIGILCKFYIFLYNFVPHFRIKIKFSGLVAVTKCLRECKISRRKLFELLPETNIDNIIFPNSGYYRKAKLKNAMFKFRIK